MSQPKRRASAHATPPAPPVEPVSVSEVNPLAWHLAMHIARGDRARLQITGRRTVVVMNRPRQP